MHDILFLTTGFRAPNVRSLALMTKHDVCITKPAVRPLCLLIGPVLHIIYSYLSIITGTLNPETHDVFQLICRIRVTTRNVLSTAGILAVASFRKPSIPSSI